MTDCTCDLDYFCGQHTDCPLCGREMPDVDQSDGPVLCPLCERTARAHARLERQAREYPDPERGA